MIILFCPRAHVWITLQRYHPLMHPLLKISSAEHTRVSKTAVLGETCGGKLHQAGLQGFPGYLWLCFLLTVLQGFLGFTDSCENIHAHVQRAV
jgi:hypothetical protein